MSELPRLLFCAFDVIPAPTGLSRRVTEYVKGLGQHFHVVLLSAKTPEHAHIERYHGARLLRVPVGVGDLQTRLQAFDRAVRRQLSSEDYVAAHFFDPFSGYALCESRATHPLPLVYEAQSFPSEELPGSGVGAPEADRRFLARVRRQELFCLMNADAVITGSKLAKASLRRLGVSDERLHLLRAPVDVDAYRPEQLGAPNAPGLRLLYLGNEHPHQGLSTLLEAVALASKRVQLRLTLAGPPHPVHHLKLEARVAELGLGHRVKWVPPVSHEGLPSLLADCDAGVLPVEDTDRHRTLGAPLAKISEYLAAGRPVFASDLPLTRELLPDGPTLFHPPNDAAALADQLVELAREPKLRAELGRSARAYARERLDTHFVTSNLLSIYGALLGKVPPNHLVQTLSPPEPAERTTTAWVHPRPPDPSPSDAQGSPPALLPTDPGVQVPQEEPVQSPTLLEVLPVSCGLDPSSLTEAPSERTERTLLPLPDLSEQPAESEPPPPLVDDGAVELLNEELGSGEVSALADEVLPASTLDSWYAQLAWGYVPPATDTGFTRPTPPTNFPGRSTVP